MFERNGNFKLPDVQRKQIDAEANDFAREVRKKLGVNLTDPVDMIPLLEEQGILVIQAVRLGPSGFVRVLGEYQAIFLNASEPLGRQYYTAAHEYGHILRHLPCIVELEELSEDERQLELSKMECFSYSFADHFLITPEAVEFYLTKYDLGSGSDFSISDIIRIQHHFKVSYRQMTRMLRKIGIISEEQQEQLNKVSSKEEPDRLVRETEQAGYSTDLVSPLQQGRVPERFLHALITNIRNGRLTERKVRHLQEILGFSDLLQHIGEVGHEE
ncbi:MAG: ImmA/IrrE family metallo-endopeptidase [Tumebacillaceae bacterium]